MIRVKDVGAAAQWPGGAGCLSLSKWLVLQGKMACAGSKM